MAVSDLRSRFDALDLAALKLYVADHHPEGIHLDFKTVSSCDFKNADDRRNLAKALSGFANSDGGLIVWGIKAFKGDNGVDGAQELQPVVDAALFLSRLNALTSDMVSPFIDGVEHKCILEDDGSKGYAVTLVPQSELGPHMAFDNRYYKRSGESFVKLEHFDVADMFGRRARPDLVLVARISKYGTSSKDGRQIIMFNVVCSLENIGRGSAHAPYIQVDVHEPYQVSSYGVDGNMREGLPPVPSSGGLPAWGSDASVVIHPGTLRDVFCATGEAVAGLAITHDFVVDYQVAAEGVPLRRSVLTLSGAQVVDLLRR